MEDNKTRVLYDRLTQDGYDIGDFDSFSKNVHDEAKRKSLYETITNDGYDVGDFDSFSSKLVARSQEEPVTNVRTQNVQPEQPQVQPVQDMPSYDPKTQGYILENVPDMFRSKGNNLATRPLPQQDLFENNPSDLVRKIGIDQQQRVEQAQKSANDPYMKEQNLELFKRQNQEQINSVNELINAARRERAKERQQRVRSVGDGGIFSTMSQAYLAGEQNDTDKQLEYASTLMEQAQNITNEAKKKGNTNFFAGFARGFKDAPLDGWAMGLQDLKNYSAAKKVMDKVDKGEELTPSEDALMQALVTNAATQMYYSGDLGRGYKFGGVTAESLPFMLDMIAGMGAVQALTKPASKAIVKYAADKAAQMGLGRATTGLAKGAARTVAGLGDVAAHTATFGSARVAADYQRRGLGDVQVKPNADGTVSYDGRENVQTGAEALGKSIISTAAETGSELLGEYFAPMLGYIGRVTGANKVGKIIPASVGKAFKDVVNSQGFREMQEIARRAKISDPLGEYAEEVANNLVSTAIGDMTPEQLVDLDQNIDTFLGVAPMSALFGAAGTGGYLRDKYKNYRNMRNFETQMQDAMGEDWSGVREALQDADIETARNMVKDVLSSPMSPDMKKNAIKYISSVLQEQTLQDADKQMMPEEIAVEKRNIINNLNETRSKISLNDEELNSIINSEEGYQAIISQFDPETANNIMKYKQAYDDFVNYNYWVQDQADNARRQAEAQVESLTNATTGTIMRVNSGLSTNPVNVLRGNLVFDNEGKVDENQSDKTIYYMSEDGRVKMAPVSMFSSLVDNTPAEEMIQRAGNDAQEEVLQAEEAQINSIPAQEQQPIGPETRFTMGGNNYEVNRVTPDGYEVYLLDENGTPAQSQLMSEEEIRNAINGQQPANAEETQPSVTEQPVQEETSEQPAQENQTAMSRIPLNERGEQDFEAAPVADTSAALLEISDNVDDAKDTATQMIDHYNNELKKAEKAKSTGNTIQEIVKMKQEKKANIKAINDKISYWNQVAADLEAKRPTGLIAQAEEKAKENQQRLASMTAEEQQAAQQEVQKKIDAGAFERKEPRKKVRYVKEDADLGPSITPQEHVLREIATGRVSFSLSDTEGAQGLSSHLGYSNSPEERKKLVWALSSDGLTPEAAAEQIHADMPENLQGMVTDQDVFNMIINAFQEYGSPSKMWDAAKNMHGTDIEENIPGYEEDQERQLIEWEASENRMSVPEWIAYSDYIEEEHNNLYSSVTDEELNTIFEQIINDYERRAETESAGSTEGQTDSEQGNTVQPERESDNEGRTGEVEEQPEPANKTDGESGSVVPEPEGAVDNNGYPFLKSSNETTIFGEIREETGLTPAPIKLSEGFNRKDEKGRNHGYGFKHIEESHGDQIRNYGFESIPEFVESVAKNYTIVRKGNKRNGIDTYILEVSDKKNNTLFVELSKDGSYWNVNSAGVFRKGYSKKKEVVWPLPAVEDASTAEDTGAQNAADSSNSMSGNSPQNTSFVDKDTQSLEEKQEDKQKFTASEINQGEGVIEYAQRIAKEKEIWDESQKVDINPTEEQKEAGNYKMGHVKVDGMDITIENPKGSVRSGKDANGKEWSVTMNNTYGYIRGTRGVDGDHIDIFLSDNPESGNVYVIDQVDQQTGMYDESKVMYGFNSIDEARDAYLANYEKGWKVGVISEVSKEEFKKWIESSTNKIKPFSEYAGVKKMQTEDDGTAKDVEPANEKNSVPVNELPRRLREAYESGSEKDISNAENELRNYIENAEDVKMIYNTYFYSKELLSKKDILSPSGKKMHSFITGVCKEILEKKGFPSQALSNEKSRIKAAKSTNNTFVLEVMSYDNSQDVVRSVINNPNTSESVLRQIEKRFNNNGLDWEAKQVLDKRKNDGTTKDLLPEENVVPVSEKETTTNAEDTPAKSNNIVSDERYQELKNRLKQKLGQLNAGIDPEIIAIGAEMAVYHIERGAVKFADYCKAMVDDLGDVIRPYLKSFYSSARYMPQSIENGLSERMSPDSEVSQFDVTNFDKSVPDVMQQIENVAKEKEIEKATSSDEVKKSPSDLFGNSEEYQKKAEQEKEAVSKIGVKIAEKAIAKRNGKPVDPLTMKEVKDILNGYDMLSDMSATDMQELVELAMTNETRLIAKSYINGDAKKQKHGYDTIVNMYNMQPLLNARDSTRFERQQYSTPTPFGYVMGQFVKDGKTVESVLEPSAGNGALTIAFPANTVHVNDIDERRLENLRTLGYAHVTNQDALIPFEGSVDAVLTNPPFGSTTAKEFDDGQIKISSLEGLMAINALESMKDNGRAAIVIGGNTSYRDNGAMQSKDMRLFAYLYSHYNVVDVINLNGDMYKRNGTKYDVRIILINGRKTGPFKLIAPPVKSKARAEQINSFEELYNRVQDDIRSLQQMGDLFNGTEGETRTTDTEGSGANNNVSNRPKSGERGKSVRPDKKVGSDNDMGSTGNTTVSGPEQAERSTAEENAGKLDNADRSDAGSVEPVQEQRGSDNGGSTGGSRNDGSVRSDSGDNTGRSRLSVNLSDEKVPYPNRSQSGTLMSVVPANQAQVLADSLANIGDVDQFLVDQLGYSSKDELFSYLAAEQIDSVSLAINQMNKGNGFIIGDMTGVGKGRQGAALIRYAVREGYNPIYFTQKPALFSDNYRDLADIGSGDLRPFIIASDPKNAAITDASGNVVHKLPTDKEKKRVFDYIMKNGKLPEEYDYVITTYSQINNGTKEYEPKEDGIAEKDKSYKKKSPSAADKSGQERRDVIQALSKDNIMILDESHTAGGSGGGSMYMQYIMPKVKGVTFLSATFAKRADNMPIYAMKTDLSKSGISPQDMIEAISQGGVTLQEIMSKQLVQSGQMIRRERSFQGVTIDWMPVSEEEDAVQRKQFDEVSSIFSDIRAFQKDYITPIVEGISEELSEQGGYSDLQQGTAELGVTNTPFASKMYNLVNQLLFSLKADAVANRVIENLKNGFKPVISFTNTMEGFLDEAPKDTPMDKVPNFSATLMRALDGVMRYTETNLKGEKVNKFFTVNDLPEAGQNKYYEIREKIENLSADLPISPMDAIKMKIQKAGYKVGEITGRTLEMVQDENGKYVIQNRKDRDKKSAARDFNNGQLDVLMVNKSGSTGISLHASPKFEDQRQRVMVFAQFQSDINDEVQMRGRIDRTGQKFRGKYEYIMSSIPAEQRLQMMFKAKLKSLDANTTSSQKSKFNEMEVVDYLNKYGDDVTWQYMLEHPELSEKLGDPLKILTSEGEEAQSGDTNTAGKEGCAAKIARYLPFLPVKEQEEVFKDITDAYNVKIQLLNDAGENDLEITTMPLKAQTISKKIWKPGTDPNSGNAFADNTYLEEVEVDVLKKPMKAEEIKSTVSRMTSGEPFNEWLDNRVKEINSLYDGKIATLKERLDQSALERSEKAKKNYIEKSKEARKNGKNEFTDEEIEKMSEVVVEDIMKKSKESFIKQKNVIEARRENIRKQINSFTPMKPLVIPFNLDETLVTIMPSRGMFLGYKFSKDYSPSSSTAIFATLDGRRKVEIPLNQEKAFNSIRMNTMMQPTYLKDLNVDTWDSYVPTQTRKKAYIVTGNLLQALVDTKKSENVKGYLVSYSTIEGDTKQGILMSDNFKPENLTTSAPISSRLIQIQQGETVISEDKRVIVEKNTGWRSGYALKVPKSKKQGGEFFEDNKLRSLADNKEFTTRGNYMVADISSDNLSKVLDRLSKMGVTVSKKAKLENSEDVRFRVSEENQDLNNIKSEDVEETSKKLNVPVEVITSVDQIKDNSVRSAIEKGRKVKGWYSLSDNKVYVYLPNATSMEDVNQTILHEGVAHYGLRQLVGEDRMDDFLDDVFANVTDEVRKKIIDTLPRYGYNSRIATEEYMARMAENGVDVSVWQRIKQAFNSLMRRMGINIKISDNELRYILWRSRQNLDKNKPLDLAKDVAMQYQMGIGNYFREVDQTPEQSIIDAWDNIASSTMFSLRESTVDYLTAIDKFQDLISKRTGEEIKSFENAYDSMTFLSSKNRVEMDWYDSNIVTPMRKAILELVGKQKGRKWDWNKGELRKLVMYVEAKHGAERNRQMAIEKYIKELKPESLKFFENAGISIDRDKYKEDLKKAKEEAGKKAYDKSFQSIYDKLINEGLQKEEAESQAKKRAKVIADRAESNASEKFRNDFRDKLMKEYSEKVMSDWNDTKKRISKQKDISWIEKQRELDREASRIGADLSQDYSGLSSVFGDEKEYPDGWYESSLNFVEEYENNHNETSIGDLWKSISQATDYTLNKQYESGLVSKEYVDRQKQRFENYIPLRGFQDEIAGDIYNYIGNDFYPGSNPVKSAKGRTSEAGNPFGSILNTGYSTISVGNKNLAKMSLYSLVNNHDTEGLAVSNRAWMVRYDKLMQDDDLMEALVIPSLEAGEDIPEWVEAVPKYPEGDISSEEVSRILGRFEDLMKKNSKEGYAKPISKRSRIAYRTLYKERSEHEIPLYILGDKYVITITGNPRVAQAMNGLLNPNVNNKGWAEIGERMQRFMAGAFTAKNAAFSIANLTKDSMYANNQVFIKENIPYWIKFTKKQKAGFGDFIPMMMRLKKYRDGNLDLSDETNKMFKEFMDNGGATGYTFVDTQEKYAKELADKLKELSKSKFKVADPRKLITAFFDSVEFTGQAAELVNRFAAYQTSRDMGRSVTRSIRDAKEITVNFNRKGAGMKSWDDKKSLFDVTNMAAFFSQYGRANILFWNANMQAKYRFYKNIKEHPIKTSTTLIGNSMMFASVLVPFMNNFVLPALYEMFGIGSGDDDEDYYNTLTDWERTHNICIRLPYGNWLKIPLSPEMSPWYTIGDCIGGAIAGQRELSASDFIKSGIDAISPLSINWSYEGANVILNVLPTISQPVAQVAMNVNFMGNPIKKQPFTMRQGFAPQYTMVYGNTSPALIELSRLSNKLTGGTDSKTSGSLDWNPALLQNVITGYTGGYGSSFLSAADWIVSTLKGEEQSSTIGKMPLVSRFFISGNKDVKIRRINSSFYDVIKFTEEFKFDQKSLENQMNNSLKEGNKEEYMKSKKQLEELLKSDRAKKYIQLDNIVNSTKDFEKYLKEMPDDETTQGMLYQLKSKGLEILKK